MPSFNRIWCLTSLSLFSGLTSTTPTGTYLRHHDKSPRDSTAQDSREGAGSPGDRDSRGYPGDRGSRGYAGSAGDRGSKEYYPTQEDIANEERQRRARDQYGSPDYQGVAGYRDPYGESRTPGSRDSYGAPGTRDSYGRTPGSRDSYGSPDSRSPGSGYSKSPAQEDEIFTDRFVYLPSSD